MRVGTKVAAKPVTDGRRVRLSLEQAYRRDQSPVRIDWLRFTLPLGAVVKTDRNNNPDLAFLLELDKQGRDLYRACRTCDGDIDPSGAMYVVRKLAGMVASIVPAFVPGVVDDKGMDYYTARAPLTFEGLTVGWALAGGRSANQASTVHVNLFGSGCLQLDRKHLAALADWIDAEGGHITRCDLACDVFAGENITDIPRAYLAGEFDVRGQRPSQQEAGSWTAGHSRTFVVGKRETGKLLRCYEKGDELFGPEADDPWVRYEVEFRDNARVLPTDLLRRPADFFGAAYQFCEDLLNRLEASFQPERIPAGQRLKDKTEEAAVRKLLAWTKRVAAPTLCWALVNGGEVLDHIVSTEAHRLPGRLRGFTSSALRAAASKVAGAFAPVPTIRTLGA